MSAQGILCRLRHFRKGLKGDVMGGRGGSSGLSSGGVIDKGAKIQEVIGESRGKLSYNGQRFPASKKDEILEAKGSGTGSLQLDYAEPYKTEYKNTSGMWIRKDTYKLKAGSDNGKFFGINWDNVKEVYGKTYNIKDELKKRGFKWNGARKAWTK